MHLDKNKQRQTPSQPLRNWTTNRTKSFRTIAAIVNQTTPITLIWIHKWTIFNFYWESSPLLRQPINQLNGIQTIKNRWHWRWITLINNLICERHLFHQSNRIIREKKFNWMYVWELHFLSENISCVCVHTSREKPPFFTAIVAIKKYDYFKDKNPIDF